MGAVRFAELAMSTWYGQMMTGLLSQTCQKSIGLALSL